MRFTAIERITADVQEDGNVILTNDALTQAEHEADDMARIVNRKVAGAVYRPLNIQHHAAGLAAYAVWLADLFGWDDTDWLHNG